ncbi:hypothetical protein SAMN04489723_103129 [Algoriphagus aquimarinus]|uniref:Uncharacterized protein n=1 Tax=Algoriphagus aquimarinus TaxID=237018 RepID=A0A1I0XFY3_9BACT|nr:hypothetical protein SAMN04489723_103129 [Algoriphagus aquimarinus]|tara:strand:+ start:104543 stop:104710 length:168 start_codon:yes stop_codon:yes gene_type:complete
MAKVGIILFWMEMADNNEFFLVSSYQITNESLLPNIYTPSGRNGLNTFRTAKLTL